ncbi:glycosyltransferase 87 family protein [Williamsia maris]|uniref:Alpha-1,2-mannosyltransferase n=1 Tax=Williamsia maris TaxID=72806 RepID=A0ABT1HDD8_9NOCA|nr:glycosyltransferase 87 family protein [Williamsia maris]MCP2175683.1 alpha-1,2-mannosyltransferase [Williamsia maris]
MPDLRVPRPVLVTTIAVALGLLAIWLQHVVVAFDEPFWGLFDNQLDLDVYRAGAQTVLDGQRLYDAKLLGHLDYTYAPISVLLFTPFAWMPFAAARVVWSVLIFVVLYLVITLSFRNLGYRITWQLRAISASLVVISALLEPVRSTIWFGQVNIFLMALVLWDLLRPESSRLRGVATGVAAGIKLTPLIFIVYLAAQRRWRSVAGVLAGFVATVVIAFVAFPRDSWQYWTGTFIDSDRVGVPDTVGNQSIRGALANNFATSHPSTIAWLVLALAALALGLAAALMAHRRGHELLALTLVGLTSCAVSPMSWGHHWVWIVPLGVIALHHVFSARTAVHRLLAGAGVVGLVLTTFAWRTHLAGSMTFVGVEHPDAYYTGLFFKYGISWLRWFTYDPYNWIFVVAAVTTIVALATTRPRAAESPPRVSANR